MITKDWIQAQLIAYSLQQTNSTEDLSSRFADIIIKEIVAETFIDELAEEMSHERN